MLDQDIKIISQHEDMRLDEAGKAVRYIRIAFKVGDDGPFRITLDREGFTAFKRDEAVNTLAREVRR